MARYDLADELLKKLDAELRDNKEQDGRNGRAFA